MKISYSSYDFAETENFVDLLFSADKNCVPSPDVVADFSQLKWTKSFSCFASYKVDVLYRICGYVVVSLKMKGILSGEKC